MAHKNQDNLDNAARALLNMPKVSDRQEPLKMPTKADLDRRFAIRMNGKGKPILIEKWISCQL